MLTLLSIAIGSSVVAAAIKVVKSTTRPESVAAHPLRQERGRFTEVLTVEEGASAGRQIDLAKFQNLVITVLLLLAYVAQAVAAVRAVDNPAGTPRHTMVEWLAQSAAESTVESGAAAGVPEMRPA